MLVGSSFTFLLSHAASTFAHLSLLNVLVCYKIYSLVSLFGLIKPFITNLIVAFSEHGKLAICFKFQITEKLIYIFFLCMYAKRLRKEFAIF